MTDAEIVKALEVCVGIHNDCEDCPLLEHSQATDECMTELMSNALDLINRQKAEIERLEAEIDKQYEQARADILGNMSDGGASCHWCISQHKSEAIKEFAERLKEHKYQSSDWSHGEHPFVVEEDDIDNLEKEMVGDTE